MVLSSTCETPSRIASVTCVGCRAARSAGCMPGCQLPKIRVRSSSAACSGSTRSSSACGAKTWARRLSSSCALARCTNAGGPGGGSSLSMCGPLESTSPRSATITCITDSIRAATWRTVASTLRGQVGQRRQRLGHPLAPPGGLIVCSATAKSSAFLSGKTRKMVPSAMPAASAICRVVTRPPCSAYSGSRRRDDRRPPVVGGHRGCAWGHEDDSVSE